MEKATGAWPPGLPQMPQLPFGLQHIWEAYLEIRAESPPGYHGPAPLDSAALLAWNTRTGAGLRSRHFDLLRRMDAQYLDLWYG